MSDTETETPVEAPEPEPEPEPVNPDAEPEPEPEPIEPPSEPPAEPVAPEGMSEKEREKQQTALDKEAKRHTERVALLLGDEATEAILCPFCDPQLQGFLWPESLDQPRDEIQARMIEVLRQPEALELLDATDVRQCDACNGEGKVKTGSRVPTKETKSCSHCSGFGYYPPPGLQRNGAVTPEDELALVTSGAGPMVQDDVDPSGHPKWLPDGRENPNYGKWPQYVDPQYP